MPKYNYKNDKLEVPENIIKSGDIKKIRQLLDNTILKETKEEYLAIAIDNKNYDTIKFFIEMGVTKSNLNVGIIKHTIESNNLEMLEFFINNLDLYYIGRHGEKYYYYDQIIHFLFDDKYLESFKIVFKRFRNIDYLFLASTMPNTYEIVKYILSTGINIHKVKYFGLNILNYMLACDNMGYRYSSARTNINLKIVQMLINNKIDLNEKNTLVSMSYCLEVSPLESAVIAEHVDLIKLLVKSGANIDLLEKCNMSLANMCILRTKNLDIAKYLIENSNKFDVNKLYANFQPDPKTKITPEKILFC